MISREDFARCMKDIERVDRYHCALNSFFDKNDVDGYLFQPDCLSTVLFLLSKMFDNDEFDELVNYYIYDLGFGKHYKPGIIKDKDCHDIPLQNVDDLYDILCKKGAHTK